MFRDTYLRAAGATGNLVRAHLVDVVDIATEGDIEDIELSAGSENIVEYFVEVEETALVKGHSLGVAARKLAMSEVVIVALLLELLDCIVIRVLVSLITWVALLAAVRGSKRSRGEGSESQSESVDSVHFVNEC